MSDQNILYNQKGRISSWTGIIILIIIAIAVWIILLTYSGPKMEVDMPIQTAPASEQDSQTSIQPGQNKIFSYSGQVIEKTSGQVIIQLDQNKGGQKITGLIDDQTQLIRKGIPQTNPEGERSGQLFKRESIDLADIQIGDQVSLKSYPDTPVNNLTSFKAQTVEVRYTY